MQFIKSTRGKRILIFIDYVYNSDGILDDKHRFRCKTRTCRDQSQ
jgi:hypothetical protein